MSVTYLNRYSNKSRETHNSAMDPNQAEHPRSENYPGMDDLSLDEGFGSDNFSDELGDLENLDGSSPQPQGISKKEALQWIKDLIPEFRKNKNHKDLNELEEIYKTISRTQGQEVSMDLASSLMALAGESSDGSDGDLDGADPLFSGEPTPSSLRKELEQLKGNFEANADLSEDQKDTYLEKIKKLELSLDLNPSEDGLGSIQDDIEGLKMGEDLPGSGGSDADEELGEAPTREAKGVRYYESKSKDFDLVPSAKGGENIVSTPGNVTISPVDKKARVVVTEAGGHIVVRVKGEKKDTVYKIKDNVEKIQINSKNISGDFENEDGLVVGSKGEKFISEEMLSGVAEKLQDSLGKIPSKYSSDGEDETRDVKNVIEMMAGAIGEKDPKEKAVLWEDVNDVLSRWLNAPDPGQSNDRAAVLCWVLHGEFGEKGFKQLLKDGIIPREIATTVAQVISLVASEMLADAHHEGADILGDLSFGILGDFDRDSKTTLRGTGSLGWNHKMYADFLEKHAAKKYSVKDED